MKTLLAACLLLVSMLAQATPGALRDNGAAA